MKAEGFKRITAIWLCSMMLLGAAPFLMGASDSGEAKVIVRNGTAYNVTTPFRINSNAEFAASGKCSEGDGSVGNPWVIENYEINGTGYDYCIYIGNTTNYFVVRNCYLYGAVGAYSWPYDPVSGLIFYNVHNGSIVNNNVYSNYNVGIYLYSSSDNAIMSNTLSLNGYGIYFASSTSNTIINNTMVNDGIHIYGNQIQHWNTHTISTSNTVNGKPVYYWKNQTGGTVPSGAGQVIFANCNNMIVKNQNVSDGSVGIEFGFSNSNTIANIIASNNQYGIYLYQSGSNTIANNTALNNNVGIYIQSSSNTIINNTVSNNEDGIYLWSSNTNTIINNTASSNNDIGIRLYSSNSNTIANNTVFSNNWAGIYFSSSNGNFIANNTASSNNWLGIYFSSSNGNFIANNTMVDDGIFIQGSLLEHWNTHTISISNTINSKPVYYLKNQTGGTVPLGAGQVIIANCTNMIAENQNVSDGYVGIEFGFSNSNTVANNIVSNCLYSIYLYNSDSNDIANNTVSNNFYGLNLGFSNTNTITNNTALNNRCGIELSQSGSNAIANNNLSLNDYGISLLASNANTIINNTVSSNNYSGIYFSSSNSNTVANNIALNNRYGIYVYQSGSNTISNNNISSNNDYGISLDYSVSNIIANNIVSSNREGIRFWFSSNNTIVNNTILNNDWGIYFEISSSSGNTFYHNNFINNTNQVCESSNTNFWNTTYPTGGNYWSDYKGKDFNCTLTQNVPPPDGIGDTPYKYIGTYGQQDNYPLMNQFNDDKINPIYPYWHNTSQITLTVVATYADYVEFWYTYASTNGSYGMYNIFANDTNAADGWSWPFTFLSNEGWYRFYSRAGNLSSGYYEAIPEASYDQECGYDTTAPTSECEEYDVYWCNKSATTINAIASDVLSWVRNVELWYRFSPDNGTTPWTIWKKALNDTNSADGWSWSFTFPNGPGSYEFYSRAGDAAGNYEDAPTIADAIAGLDNTAPTSNVSNIASYWQNISQLTINAVANDTLTGVKNVALWFRFSINNITWGNWTSYNTDSTAPWTWSFNFPNGEGYYEFFSIANDSFDNTEPMKINAEAKCAFDSTPTNSNVNPITSYWQKTIITINATTNGSLSIVTNVTLFYRFSMNNITWYNWTPYNTDLTAPWDWSFNFTKGDGFYEFFSIANDTAGNTEQMKIDAEARCAYDMTLPIISLEYPNNNSVIPKGTLINFTILDANLKFVNCTRDGFAYDCPFHFPFQVNTSDIYYSRVYTFDVWATDKALNSDHKSYSFYIGTLSNPNINSTYPEDNSNEVSPNIDILVDFTEMMNTTAVENSISITPTINISGYEWNNYNHTLKIHLKENLSLNTNYTVVIDSSAKDVFGNYISNWYNYSWSFNTWKDTDNDGTPDFQDTDDDNDGVPGIYDDFPKDANETMDTDYDGTGDNADNDDDNDGYLDEWEIFLGADPKDSNDKPLDTDRDGMPDGDATNSHPWMDTDDDGDGIPDWEDSDPLEPPIARNLLPGIILFLLILLALLGMIADALRQPKTKR